MSCYVSDEAWGALARKYRTLLEWRKRRDAQGTPPDAEVARGCQESPPPTERAALRQLAAEFPGALRELDVLRADELARRAAIFDGPKPEPPKPLPDWVVWIWTYHRLMRAALEVRRAMGVEHREPVEVISAAARRAAEIAELPLDEAFVGEVMAPAGGRLGVMVMRRVGRLFGVAPAAISSTLFPPRRPPPYSFD